MPLKNRYNVKAATPELTTIKGSFAPNGSSAVSASSRQGRGFTVARTSAGLFTLTFTEKYNALVSANATLQLAAGDDKAAQIGTYVAASKTLTIRVWDTSAAAETDVAADANNRINFDATFSNTTTLPARG